MNKNEREPKSRADQFYAWFWDHFEFPITILCYAIAFLVIAAVVKYSTEIWLFLNHR